MTGSHMTVADAVICTKLGLSCPTSFHSHQYSFNTLRKFVHSHFENTDLNKSFTALMGILDTDGAE